MDRDEAVRKAETLLRQGNLAAAITEYARVAASHPHDLPTLNKLGELYQRAGQPGDAVAQFARVADQWLREGLYPKAAAHYRKILKLHPQDESALLQLVQASIRQGLLEEAKTWLRTAREGRLARGDDAGADDLTLKLSDLDPTDFDARMTALRVRLGRETSPELVAEVRGVIAELERQGRSRETETLRASLIRLDPDDVDARVRVARAAMRRGDLTAARAALPMDTAGSERYEVIALAAELELTAGNIDAGRPLLQQMLAVDPEHAIPEIVALGERLRARVRVRKQQDDADDSASGGDRVGHADRADRGDGADRGDRVDLADRVDRQVGFICVETVVDHHAAAREFVAAAERLNRFLAQSPRHVPALLRLVEICVDGDLDPEATAASGQLAEAYLRIGEAPKARVIAEDLLIRDPRSRAQRSRLRRTLVALGEADPDAIILDIITEQLGENIDDLTEVDDLAAAADRVGDVGDVDEVDVVDGVDEIARDDLEPDAGDIAGTETGVGTGAETGARTAAEAAAGEDEDIEEPDFGGVGLGSTSGDALDTPAPVWSSESDLLFEPLDLGGWGDRPSTIEPPSSVTVSSDGGSAARLSVQQASEASAASEASGGDLALAGDLADEIDLTGALNALAQAGTAGGRGQAGDPAEGLDAMVPPLAAGAAADAEAGAEPGSRAMAGMAAAQPAVTNGTGAVRAPRAGDAADDDLEQVFDGLRARAAGDLVDRAQPDQSARLSSMAETYQAAGMYEEARAALEQVANDSRHRFRAAAALGQLFWQQGDADAALRWLELASEAPAPDPESGRAVMYELAEKLERTGETTRSLAVFLDLLAEQDDYRDVRARVDRLTRAQAER